MDFIVTTECYACGYSLGVVNMDDIAGGASASSIANVLASNSGLSNSGLGIITTSSRASSQGYCVLVRV